MTHVKKANQKTLLFPHCTPGITPFLRAGWDEEIGEGVIAKKVRSFSLR